MRRVLLNLQTKTSAEMDYKLLAYSAGAWFPALRTEANPGQPSSVHRALLKRCF